MHTRKARGDGERPLELTQRREPAPSVEGHQLSGLSRRRRVHAWFARPHALECEHQHPESRQRSDGNQRVRQERVWRRRKRPLAERQLIETITSCALVVEAHLLREPSRVDDALPVQTGQPALGIAGHVCAFKRTAPEQARRGCRRSPGRLNAHPGQQQRHIVNRS